MKIKSAKRNVAVAVAMVAGILFAVSAFAQADKSREKVSLIANAIQARESGDLNGAKASLEKLLVISPNDAGVQQLLMDVNNDIAKAVESATPTVVQAEIVAPAVAGQPAEITTASETVVSGEVPATIDAKMDEAINKQWLIVKEANNLIDAAYESMDAGKYDEATVSLNAAQVRLDKVTPELSESSKAEVKRALASMAKERTYKALDDRNMKDAKNFAEEYAANTESTSSAEKLTAKVENLDENPYMHTIGDVSPGFAERQKKAKALIEKGRIQYAYGDYDGARNTFRQVETLDASNETAKGYMVLISEKLKNAGKLTYSSTRGAMLNQIDEAWQLPQVYSNTGIDIGPDRKASPTEQKMRDIRISVAWPAGVSLNEVVASLVQQARANDNNPDAYGARGVDMVLASGVDGNKSLNGFSVEQKTVEDVLKILCEQAGCQYDIEKNGVVMITPRSNVGNYDTVALPINKNAVTSMGGGVRLTSGGSSSPFGGGSEESGSENLEETGNKIKAFLKKAGVEFGENDGSALAYDGSKLWVTNTAKNIEKVRTILSKYIEVKQVEIETKFLEVIQGDLKELNFNWKVSGTDKNGNEEILFNSNNRSLAAAFGTTTRGRDVTITSPSANGVDLNESIIPQDFPLLPGGINFAKNAQAAVNAVVGVVNGYDIKMLVDALEQKTGSDMLSAPKVTVMDGVQATITVSQQMRYPGSWGDMQSNVGSSTSSASGGGSSGAGVTITPGTPQDFATYDVGVVMEVTPSVGEDGTIALTLFPRVTEFEGFMEYGGSAIALSSGTTVVVPAGFIMPVFSVREVRTTVTVFDGATVVMGGLIREDVKRTEDQIPVLGDIPVIGRLFQSKGETRQKKNLLIFVTANKISLGGSVSREQFQDIRAGSVFQNPTVLSPGGSIQRLPDNANKAD